MDFQNVVKKLPRLIQLLVRNYISNFSFLECLIDSIQLPIQSAFPLLSMSTADSRNKHVVKL